MQRFPRIKTLHKFSSVHAQDKLAALAQLAKILGVVPEPQPQAVNHTQVNVGQVNVGAALRQRARGDQRLASALEKAQQARSLLEAGATQTPDAAP